MGESTVRSITLEVCDVLWDVLQPEYMPVPTEQDWKKYAEEFGGNSDGGIFSRCEFGKRFLRNELIFRHLLIYRTAI